MTHPAAPTAWSPAHEAPTAAPRRPASVVTSAAGSAIIGVIAVIYLGIVIALMFVDGFRLSSLTADNPEYRLNATGWQMLWFGIPGLLIAGALVLAAAASGVSGFARGIAGVLLLLTVADMVAFILIFALTTGDTHEFGVTLYVLAIVTPALLAVIGIGILVSFAMGWGYFARRAQYRRSLRTPASQLHPA